MNSKIIVIIFLCPQIFCTKIYEEFKWWENPENLDVYNWLNGNENSDTKSDNYNDKVCKTPGCQSIAKQFSSNMNKLADPCDDFDEYACGTFSKSEIPGYLPMWSMPGMFQHVVYKRIRGILEEKIKKSDILPVRQVKKWYLSCMDEETLEKRGLESLESILIRFGGWPMTIDKEEWDENEYSWKKVEDYYFDLTRSFVFYELSPAYYSSNEIAIMPGDIPLAKKLALNYRNYSGEDYKAYETLVKTVSQIFIAHNKADIMEENLQKDVTNLVEFEKQLYMIKKDWEWLSKSDFDKFIDFKNWYNNNLTEIFDDNEEPNNYKIDFDELMNKLYGLVGEHYDDNELQVGVDDKMYFIKLTKLLNETPKRTIVNYIHWHFISSMLEYSTKDIRDSLEKVKEEEFGTKERAPRWIECVKDIKMIDAIVYKFSKKYYTKETDEKIHEIAENVRKSMRQVINNSRVLEENSKKSFLKKIDEMEFEIGFGDVSKNKSKIIQLFYGLNIGHDYLENVLSYKRFLIKKQMRDFIDDPGYYISNERSMIVDASYGGNTVELPAVDFQPPLLTPQLPNFVNYGIIGSTIGHEIGHGYDTREFRYTEDGRLDALIRDNATLSKYFYKAKCFADQYNDLFNDTRLVNNKTLGMYTLRENLADTTGVQSAIIAYKKLINENGEDMKLPGFENYTDEQMFFISYANTWCEAITEKFADIRKNMDSHAPGRLRLIGGVSNTEEFARAFNCPKGSKMNPINKCNLWIDTAPTKNDHKLHSRRHKNRRNQFIIF